jgi:four helix bundle protein
MSAHRYQDLLAWQKAIAFVERVYVITSKLPQEEMFGLKSQMRRSAVSVSSNIAEGQGCATRGEFRQFLGNARGSLYELETQILIASKLGYVSAEESDTLLEESRALGRILNGLIGSLKTVVAKVVFPATDNRQLTTDN